MSKKTSTASKVASGLGAAALAAGAAAAYYFSGPDGKKHIKQAKDWGKKAKAEMAKKLKKMKTVSKHSYEQAGKEILAKYKQAKDIDPKELMAFGQELKGHWNQIAADAAKLAGKSARASSVSAKKAKGKKR